MQASQTATVLVLTFELFGQPQYCCDSVWDREVIASDCYCAMECDSIVTAGFGRENAVSDQVAVSASSAPFHSCSDWIGARV